MVFNLVICYTCFVVDWGVIMKRAIVLSGGGSKGAYQIGFWKAIRELDINYDIVTGTSIGALNGVFMAQEDYLSAFKLWYNMNSTRVLSEPIEASFETLKGKKEIIIKYTKGALKGGLDVPALRKTIIDNFKPERFFNSNIDYGLVTTKVPSMKMVTVTKDKLTKDNLPDYLLASAACFPAFKLKSIDNEMYADGGYLDNFPINLALEMGADEVIAVSLKAIGKTNKIPETNVPIKLIMPRNDIGNFLVIEKEIARRAIRYGYNDTMKAFDELEGNKYTFKKGSLERNFKRNQERFYELFNIYLDKFKDNKNYKRLLGKNKIKAFNEILENTLRAFEIDDSKIYRASLTNVLIRKALKKSKFNSYVAIKSAIKNNTLKSAFVSKELICFIYDEMNKKGKPGKFLDNIATLFPSSYLCALYLKMVVRSK